MSTLDQIMLEHRFLVERYLCSSRKRGISSDALVRAAITGEPAPDSEYPRDFGDLRGCLIAYCDAPLHLRIRMDETLRRYCAALSREPAT